MPALRSDVKDVMKWAVVCVIFIPAFWWFGTWLVTYWEGEARTEKSSAPSPPISTSVVLSQPAAAGSLAEAWHDERYCLKRKQEFLEKDVSPINILQLQPG